MSDGVQHQFANGQKAFCALRTSGENDDCSPCGNNYIKNCKPSGWDAFMFVQGRKKMLEKIFEAHHLLCIACVTDFIGNNTKIIDIVKQTEWCINAKKNMFAMPLWGNTICYYCDLEDEGVFLLRKKGPPFQNIPQHNYDHNSKTGYTSEVNAEMKNLAQEIAKLAKQNHQAAVKELKETLNDLSDDFRSELKRRGRRSKGTHKAWHDGMVDPDGDWYKPFSMANDGAEEKRFFPIPESGEKMANKIKKIVSDWEFWN